MPIAPRAEYVFGDTAVIFQAPGLLLDRVGMILVPASLAAERCEPRETLDEAAVRRLPQGLQPAAAWEVDPLIHLKLRGSPAPGGYAGGRTLRAGPDTAAISWAGQNVMEEADQTCVRTSLVHPSGLALRHEIRWRGDESILRVRTSVRNAGESKATLDLLTSFSLGGLSPFDASDSTGRLRVHRFRSAWSAEGRHEATALERLHLEPSWTGHGIRCERFGQVGSLPINGFFPFVAVEDSVAGVTWAASLACPGSWQMEIFRRSDQLAISGGLADREFGHWSRTLAPGEELTGPEARLTVVRGGIDEACERLTSATERCRLRWAGCELGLPIAFNEWCASWGNPTHDKIVALADRLKDSGVRYLVIDDGWSERSGEGIQQNGDWEIDRAAFPWGLRATAEAVRARGLIPGIWFEFEVVNAGSKAWGETAHLLHRDGVPLQVGSRRFWDFRDPWVHDYLERKVIACLEENGFGYLKVDYNDSIGLGCDGADSLGEGLRQHLAGVQFFFRRLRRRLPELVIENCSSGGHRLEPSLLELTALSSFSDAHETPDIPIIAGNLHRLVPASQMQVWAVLRGSDSRQRLSYSLAATFLGRMCLSGDIRALDAEQWAFLRKAIEFYHEAAPLIAAGKIRRFGQRGDSLRHPTGWQAVIFVDEELRNALVVWHAFADTPTELHLPVPTAVPRQVCFALSDCDLGVRFENGEITLDRVRPGSGGAIKLG